MGHEEEETITLDREVAAPSEAAQARDAAVHDSAGTAMRWDWEQYNLRPAYDPRAFEAVKQRVFGSQEEIDMNAANAVPGMEYRVLDVGCGGEGYTSRQFIEAGLQVVASDPNPYNLSRIEQKFSGYPGVSTAQGTGQNTNVPSELNHKFDLIVAGNVAVHFRGDEDRQAAQDEFRRLLRKDPEGGPKTDGWLCITYNKYADPHVFDDVEAQFGAEYIDMVTELDDLLARNSGHYTNSTSRFSRSEQFRPEDYADYFDPESLNVEYHHYLHDLNGFDEFMGYLKAHTYFKELREYLESLPDGGEMSPLYMDLREFYDRHSEDNGVIRIPHYTSTFLGQMPVADTSSAPKPQV